MKTRFDGTVLEDRR